MNRAALAAVLLAVSVSAAFAHGDGADPFSACRDDQQRLCADVKPGGGRIMECMRSHLADLSDACRAVAQDKLRQDDADPLRACRADQEKVCGDVKPGDGRVADCMKAHLDGLSAACRAAMKGKLAQDAADPSRPCRKDAAAFCAGIKPGDGRLLGCLRARKDLSKECREALARKDGADAAPKDPPAGKARDGADSGDE